METGIYDNMPFDEYLAIEALNNSSMLSARKSPRHFKCRRVSEIAKHFSLGSFVHCGVLEPSAVRERYAAVPDYHLHEQNTTATGSRSKSRSTKYVRDLTEKFSAMNAGKEIIPRDWFATLLSVSENIAACEAARDKLSVDMTEVSIVWVDEATGIKCKGRIDAVSPGDFFADLKTTVDISKFCDSIARYSYCTQMAHYQSGWRAITGDLLTPWIVAVEKERPFCVQSAPVCADSVAFGELERRKLLSIISDCRKSNEWPGPESPDEWKLPEWITSSEPIELVVSGQKVRI